MPGWAWALIVAGLIVLAIAIFAGMRQRRSMMLRRRFGPEYDRTVEGADRKRDAESELAARAERRDELDIRPLPHASRERYVAEWQQVQARFVDDPQGAVHEADVLIQSVMSERGYPVNEFEQRADVVSVDHPKVVENYRQGHRLANASAAGEGTTEDLRQAMRHYRTLFEDLVEESADTPLSRDEAPAETDARRGQRAVR